MNAFVPVLTVTTALLLMAGCQPSVDDNASSPTNGSATAQNDTILSPDEQGRTLMSAKDFQQAGVLYNPEAPIPSQCYTDTQGKHNPCYVCHQAYPYKSRPNAQNDIELQGDYGFSDAGLTNSWRNLFADRREAIHAISDETIQDYINQDNYSDLLQWMSTDAWTGVNPQLANLHLGADAFNQYGLANDGSHWVAFNYKPLPSTFWPTNGATDDVMVRLPKAFREINGRYDASVYYANLSLMELAISGADSTTTIPLDETVLGVDIDGDGQLNPRTTHIQRRDVYLGDAASTQVHDMLYPQGIEFLHTVRYVGVANDGSIVNAPRMKEVRYMKKHTFLSADDLDGRYFLEGKEKHFEKLPTYVDKGDRGMSNKHGWLLWGFIEDQHGVLRKQTTEEQFYCTGCHKSIGSTIDDTFAFPRKVAGAAGWGYIDLTKMLDTPSRGETQGEYLTYLERVGGGDEFRQNQEMKDRWFDQNGQVKKELVKSLPNIYALITPSKERALALNKAYKLIVEEQSFIFGRDTVLQPATNVLKTVDENKAPLEPEYRHSWDIRPTI